MKRLEVQELLWKILVPKKTKKDFQRMQEIRTKKNLENCRKYNGKGS